MLEVAMNGSTRWFSSSRLPTGPRGACVPFCLALPAALVIAGLTLAFSFARADGGFVWHNRDVDIREPEQKALLVFDHGVEDLVLEVKYEGASEDFGWIVPLPSRPEMTPDRPELFEELSKLTQSPRHARGDLVAGATRGMSSELSGVSVLEHRRVGVYDATVLAAGRGDALSAWLAKHGFHVAAGGARVLDGYARRGWVFTALRIHPAERDSSLVQSLAAGTIQPLRFRFRSTEPVYPLAISALTKGRSVVLLYVLARKPLVHRTCLRAIWDEHVFGPFHAWGADTAQAGYRGLDQGHGYLTKLRALVEPRDMEDVLLRTYDPAAALGDPSVGARAEAASDLGWRKPPGAERALARFLGSATGSGPDVLAGLWAMGELGGPLAAASLVRWADADTSIVRLGAIEALTRTGRREGLAVALRGLERPDRTYDYFVRIERRACLDLLLGRGDSTCVPALREILVRHEQERNPMSWEPGIADLARAALAGCGDAEARWSLRVGLARGMAATWPEALVEAARRGGSSNGFPMGFWTGRAVLQGFDFLEWPALGMMLDLLGKRPEVRDTIFREVLRESSVPDAARIILTSYLGRVGPAERDSLFAVWSRSLGSGRVMARVAMESHRPLWGRWAPVVYNLNACGVAYAFARLKSPEALLRLKEECPDDDPVLRGEIAHAMALCGSPRLTDAVFEYVATAWDSAAADSLFEQSLVASRSPNGRLGLWRSDLLDLPYRTHEITSFLCYTARDTSVLRRLLVDGRLHPALRIYWMENVPFYSEDCAPLYPVALNELETIATSPASRPFEVELARDTRASLIAVHEAMGRRRQTGE
jgi:hypothetical protein